MSVKHLKEYYEKVCRDRQEAIEEIADFEKECANSLIEPERLEQLKNTLKPILTNYEQISYIMYLLNMPNRKKDIKTYNKLNRNKIEKLVSPENRASGLQALNKEALEKIQLLLKRRDQK